jgi:hypothetical protein
MVVFVVFAVLVDFTALAAFFAGAADFADPVAFAVLLAFLAFAPFAALVALVILLDFVSFAARGMVIFPYGVGYSTIFTVIRTVLRGVPIPRAEKLPDYRHWCHCFRPDFHACSFPDGSC